jgi:tetratricopeptide (TPR) repeat protein
MLHRDFLMRQLYQAIQAIMQALTRVNALKSEEKYEEAIAEIDQAFGGIDMAPRPVGELSADEIIAMCRTSRGFEGDLAAGIADLITEEGEIRSMQSGDERARACYEKALSIYRHALSAEGAAVPLDLGKRMDRLEALLDGA